jgi:hypothetical protein
MMAFGYRIESGAPSIEPMARKAKKSESFLHKGKLPSPAPPKDCKHKSSNKKVQKGNQYSSNRFIIEIGSPGGKKSGRFGNC